MSPFSYPPAHQDDVVENFHGTPVPDPYRWLEDMQSVPTRAWLEAQMELTTTHLHAYPHRDQLHAGLSRLWNYRKYQRPVVKKGSRYFLFENDDLRNQPVLYRLDSLAATPVEVIDPNRLSDDGTVALYSWGISDDGRYLAYGCSSGGSDLQEVRVRDIDTGKDLDEVIKWGRFVGIAWKPDNSGFFYNRFPEPGTVPDDKLYFNSKLYFHRLGTPQSADTIAYQRPDAPEMLMFPERSHNGDYLFLIVAEGASSRNRLYVRHINSDGDFTRLVDDLTYMNLPIDVVGSTLYVSTDRGAPRGKVLALDLNNPGHPDSWRTVIPEHEDTIAAVKLVSGHLVVSYLHDAYHQLRVFTLEGTFVREIPMPTIGSIIEISGDPDGDELFINFESFLFPTAIFRYHFPTASLTTFRDSGLDFDSAAYQTTQVFAVSKDGTRVPVFLTHKKGLALDSQRPTLLTAYGGYGVNNTPFFDPACLYNARQNGVLALAILRGGGEYGESWHQGGMLENKQNCFDDFIAAAEWLIENRYTSPARLTTFGASNGGLLVAACMLQRPELYGTVLCGVPVTDMLRFHRFTAGRFWTGEYGNAEENPDHFKFLYAYSPLHNVESGVQYPPIIILTAEGDDRVVPLHSMKFAAALQFVSDGANPILLRFEFKAGHGYGKPVAKLIEEAVDNYTFIFQNQGLTPV